MPEGKEVPIDQSRLQKRVTSKRVQLPPEDRAIMRTALGEVKKNREARKAGESPEAMAGKERLAEFIERGDLSEVLVRRLADYLGCEPWEALARAEDHPNVLVQLIDKHKLGEKKIAYLKSRSDEKGMVDAILSQRLENALDGNAAVRLAVTELVGTPSDDPNFSKLGRDDVHSLRSLRVRVDPAESLLAKSLLATDYDLLVKIGGDLGLDPRFVDGRFWTMAHALASELPERYGYKDKKDVDLTMKAAIEKLGRVLQLKMRLSAKGAVIGDQSPEDVRLSAIDVEQAKLIAEEYRAAQAEYEAAVKKAADQRQAAFSERARQEREVEIQRTQAREKEEQEREQKHREQAQQHEEEQKQAREAYKQSMRGLLQDLKEVDDDIESPGTAVSTQHGFIAKIIRTLNGLDRKEREANEQRISSLITKREQLVEELNRLNRTVAKNAQPFAEYGELKLDSNLEEWRSIAQEQDEIVVAEELARKELKQLKAATPPRRERRQSEADAR